MGLSRYEVVFVGARIEVERYQDTKIRNASVRCDCDTVVYVDAYCAKCGTKHRIKSTEEVTLKNIPPAIMDVAPDNISDWSNRSFWYVTAHESGVIRDGVEVIGALGGDCKDFYLGVELCTLDDHGMAEPVSIASLERYAYAVRSLAHDIGLAIVGEPQLHILTYWY